MGVNSLPKTVTRQRRDCDLNPGPSAPESSMLNTRLPSKDTPNVVNKRAHSDIKKHNKRCTINKLKMKITYNAGDRDL